MSSSSMSAPRNFSPRLIPFSTSWRLDGDDALPLSPWLWSDAEMEDEKEREKEVEDKEGKKLKG